MVRLRSNRERRPQHRRHRHCRLADRDVAQLLESLMGIAYRAGGVRVRASPREPALRHARVCYDHLAGALGARLLRRFIELGWARRVPASRVVRFSAPGEAALRSRFKLREA
jgi:hypothetical protein